MFRLKKPLAYGPYRDLIVSISVGWVIAVAAVLYYLSQIITNLIAGKIDFVSILILCYLIFGTLIVGQLAIRFQEWGVTFPSRLQRAIKYRWNLIVAASVAAAIILLVFTPIGEILFQILLMFSRFFGARP